MDEYGQKIHRIELPVPFPLKTINVYLVDQERITLIDTGIKTDISFQVLEDSLRRLGYGIEDIKRILITHGHLDHYGQAKRISALSGAEVFIHVEGYRRIRSIAQFRRQVASVLVQNGTPKDLVDETIQYIKAALEKILHHHEQRLATVLSFLSLDEKTAYDISSALFPDTKSFEVFLGVSEVLGHLSILLEKGKIFFRSRNGIDYYSIRDT